MCVHTTVIAGTMSEYDFLFSMNVRGESDWDGNGRCDAGGSDTKVLFVRSLKRRSHQ